MSAERPTAGGRSNSVTAPAGVIRPIAPGEPLFRASTYQTFPSGPAAMSTSVACIVGRENSVMTPVGVIRPSFPLPPVIVNQRLPSRPTVIAQGWPRPGTDHSVIDPDRVIRPTFPPPVGRKTVY